MKTNGLSVYKLKRLAIESLRNSIRLHLDAILLFKNDSFPTSFQISVLALEEFSKANWVDHYIWTAETNDGYVDEVDEQEWLKLLYFHPKKQWNFIARDLWDVSPKFVKLVKSGGLEQKKQNATYVGLARSKGQIDTSSRISLPTRIKQKDAVQMISLLNDEFLRICQRIEEDDYYFEGAGRMDNVFDYNIYKMLLRWPHKSGIKNSSWWKKRGKVF